VTPADVRGAASSLRHGGLPGGSSSAFVPLTESGQVEREAMRGLRRRIAQQMVASTTTIPHFTYVDEADMGAIVQMRQTLKAEAEAQGVRLSYLAFVGLAVRRALQDYPEVNAWHDDEAGEVVRHPDLNLGISVDTPRGLYVAVVRDVGTLGLFGLAQAIDGVVSRVRDNSASSEELGGSTFTITSVGNIGGLFATPVINKPEVAILGMNRIVDRPVVRDGQVVVRPMAYLSPSFDHRVVDGAVGARFTSRLKQLLEEPARIWMPEG
jgi:2-oxoisovalerate dehydrogenase E2 component (dihydrolipoyl transacylase)